MYKSMQFAYNNGMLTDPLIVNKYLELHDEYKYLNVKPPSNFAKPYHAFWQIRNTLMHDKPIPYSEIDSYNRLMQMELLPYQVKLITDFDRVFYRYSDNSF